MSKSSTKHGPSSATKPDLLGVKWENNAVSALLNEKAGDETRRGGQAIVSDEPEDGVKLTDGELEGGVKLT